MNTVQTIDWMTVATVVGPLAAVAFGAWLNNQMENRPRLLSYLGHASAFTARPQGAPPVVVHTHAIVVRNSSRRVAHNIRLGHRVLPDFTIYPSIDYSVQQLPDGTSEIVIPTMVRSEEITVSYLYFPPLTWDQINAYTKSDEGFAKIVRVLPTTQHPRGVVWSLLSLAFIGLCTVLYFAARALSQWW